MRVIDGVCAVVSVLSILFGLNCYRELWRWAKQCQNARIAVAYKQKVKLQAPLAEWLTWANSLNRDEASGGRAIYKMGGTTIAIYRPRNVPRVRTAIARARNARKRKKAPVE